MESCARKILVLVDVRTPRCAAVHEAARLAHEDAARVELYDCGGTEALPPGWASEDSLDLEYRALVYARRLTDLEYLARPLRSRGIDVTTIAEEGQPLDEAIVQHVLLAEPDLIVMDGPCGAADEAWWQKRPGAILRRHARCPVLLVGENRLADNASDGLQQVT